ncbi:uncharacterized protein ARMOST_02874 [Armillaria ostoyae]|uniref:F-box domain-containing protein n=1 Tax=Armillaria ostoyae TaxID=47428 RepID=A0A284QSW5_ARMOS|nr:uncharacterized protein ARMOST_02874 [Armillaria ostoyae]
MSPPPSQDIPVDVFYEILLRCGVRAKDLCFLWLNCRPVSRNCKDAVERVFATKHLKKTWLRVDTGAKLRTEFQFYRLDPTDSTRAIFESYKYKDGIEEALRTGPSLECPNMVIQVRREVNDTVLPDFRYHSDSDLDLKFEVSFDWKGMYCHFFREQKEVQKRLDALRRHGVDRPSWMKFMKFRSMMFGMDVSKISCDVRGERIRWNVLENEGRQVHGDYPGFGKLERKRGLAEWEDAYSDESEVGEETDEDEEEDEVSDSDVSSEASSEEDDEDSDDSDSDD